MHMAAADSDRMAAAGATTNEEALLNEKETKTGKQERLEHIKAHREHKRHIKSV